MSVADSDIKSAQARVGEDILDRVRSPDQASSGEKSPSGAQGKGTGNEPYDLGNQPEQTAPTNITETELLSGRQGPGTARQPYDQGNQPEQTNMSIVDDLSRTKTKEEIAERREKKRKESMALATVNETPLPPTITTTTNTSDAEPSRGRDRAESTTVSSAPKDVDTKKLAPKAPQQFERSVSPGQLDDGSHVKCSGERGYAYSPPTKFDKFRGKLHIGSH